MKTTTLRNMLLGAMALFSTQAMADTTVVGLEDNTTGWWTAFSDYYYLQPNKTLTLEFTNFSSKANNWNNWIIAVTNDADRSDEANGYEEYFVLRNDNWGWKAGTDTRDGSWFTSLTSNYNWDTFLNDMDGSKVVMTVKRQGATVTVYADITTTAGTKYFEEFVIDCGDGTQLIRAFLTTEGGHLVIDNDKTTITDSPAKIEYPTIGSYVGAEDNSTPWWSAFSNYYTIPADNTLTLEFDNYSSKANSWNNWLTVVSTAAERGADDYAEYVVWRADGYGWQGANNTGDDSDNSWFTSNTNNYNWDTFLNDMDGAHVVMTVTRNGAEVNIHADITPAGQTEALYYQDFIIDCGDGTQPINVFLTTEKAHLIIDDSKTKIEAGAGETKQGDVNGDGNVNVGDIMAVINIMAEQTYKPEGDVNNDGSVNVGDIMAVINIMANK